MNYLRLISPDFITGRILSLGKAILDLAGLCLRKPAKSTLRLARLVLTVKPRYTMLSTSRLINLYSLAQRINQLRLAGAIVECGVWNGGSAAIMAKGSLTANSLGQPRPIWLFDSFAGLPQPGEKDGPKEKQAYFPGWNKGEAKKVEQIFLRLGLGLDNIHIITGWFDDTLPNAQISTIALLHIDADWYTSVKTVLDQFYDKVVPGGFIVLDDYFVWPGCRRALEDFLKQRRLEAISLSPVGCSAFFQKP